MNKHGLWMIIGCVLPLLLIFILPALGVTGDYSTFLFIVFMFACHLLMMGGHGNHGGNKEGVKHEHH
jgi:hypothetical protein